MTELQESIKFLNDRFNAFLKSQPEENKIIYDDDDDKNNGGIVKGIELKPPEINNKTIGKNNV